MKSKDIKVGGVYVAKVSGKLTRVRVDQMQIVSGLRRGSWNRSAGRYDYADATHYSVTNLATGRQTIFRSAAKFRCEDSPTALRDEHRKRLIGRIKPTEPDLRHLLEPKFKGINNANCAKQAGSDAVSPTCPSSDRGREVEPADGPAAAQGTSPLLAAVAGSSGEPVDAKVISCAESGSTDHSFIPDFNVDPTGETMRCSNCGLLSIPDKVTVMIGRHNGPCTDVAATSEFASEQVETIKDVLAMVNLAAKTDGWYMRVNGGNYIEPTF